MNAERWAPIKGFEGSYAVSNMGRVKRLFRVVQMKDGRHKSLTETLITGSLDDKGYVQVGLHLNGVEKKRRVHQLVAEAFIGPRPHGMVVAHNDGSRSNNQSSNLRYDTQKGNLLDMVAHKTAPLGERHPQSKLTWADVARIRADGRTQTKIAAEFGVSQTNISQIKSGATWVLPAGASS